LKLMVCLKSLNAPFLFQLFQNLNRTAPDGPVRQKAICKPHGW
jgi:hypothetical protein